MSNHCTEETRDVIKTIVDYLAPRDNKPDIFLTLEQIFVSWSVLNVCIREKVIPYTDDEFMELGLVAMTLARIIDKPNDEGRRWRSFT